MDTDRVYAASKRGLPVGVFMCIFVGILDSILGRVFWFGDWLVHPLVTGATFAVTWAVLSYFDREDEEDRLG